MAIPQPMRHARDFRDPSGVETVTDILARNGVPAPTITRTREVTQHEEIRLITPCPLGATGAVFDIIPNGMSGEVTIDVFVEADGTRGLVFILPATTTREIV